MIQPSHLIGVTLFATLLVSCSKESTDKEVFEGISYVITDQRTGSPIENATIRLLEGGPSFVSDQYGLVRIPQTDLQKYEIAVDTGLTYGFSISHADFHPFEFNHSKKSDTISMVPDTIGYFRYNLPVQLNDGISVASYRDVDMDSAYMAKLLKKITDRKYRDLHSLLIYKDGHLIFEDYYFGNNDTIDFEGGVKRDKSPAPIYWSRNEKHYVASVNKSLTSIVAGIALDASGVGTDAVLKDYLPDYADYFAEDANKSAVTFNHALNMTLGFQWDEWGSNDLVLLWKATDFADFLLSRPNRGPGSSWSYNSASPNVVLQCLSNMTGENIRTWAQTNFYGKLGITDYKWQSQPGGQYPEGAARMYMRPRDMLKIGITLLDDGKWKGEQVIPLEYVQKIEKVQTRPDAGDYSYHFWHRNLNRVPFYCAEGDGGNYINVIPQQNMVIVITQGLYLTWPVYVNQANDIIGNYVLRAFE